MDRQFHSEYKDGVLRISDDKGILQIALDSENKYKYFRNGHCPTARTRKRIMNKRSKSEKLNTRRVVQRNHYWVGTIEGRHIKSEELDFVN